MEKRGQTGGRRFPHRRRFVADVEIGDHLTILAEIAKKMRLPWEALH
jgi:hypothetical protein